MEKNIYLKDYLASRIISFNKTLDSGDYAKMYYRTNEDLVDDYLDTDFKDKKVLSVQASSDQLFTARYLEAKQVDTFDKNRLTLYYYYLRKWSIEYRHELYPNILEGNNKWLQELLKEVKPKTEMEQRALLFFRKHIQERTKIRELFFQDEYQQKGATLFQSAKDLEDCITQELRFRHLNLFVPLKELEQYDIVLISNILDWAKEEENLLKVAANNLSKLVKTGGVILCSNLVHRKKSTLEREREIFSPFFEKEEKKDTYIYHKK